MRLQDIQKMYCCLLRHFANILPEKLRKVTYGSGCLYRNAGRRRLSFTAGAICMRLWQTRRFVISWAFLSAGICSDQITQKLSCRMTGFLIALPLPDIGLAARVSAAALSCMDRRICKKPIMEYIPEIVQVNQNGKIPEPLSNQGTGIFLQKAD